MVKKRKLINSLIGTFIGALILTFLPISALADDHPGPSDWPTECYCEEYPASASTADMTSMHVHKFVKGIIYEATTNADGLEGIYCESCGFVMESSPISAFAFTLDKYAQQKIDAAKPGQTIVLEFGEFNSFPKSFMQKIAGKVNSGVSFEFRYKVNHQLTKIKIPAGATVDTNLDWYGPATMEQLYGVFSK